MGARVASPVYTFALCSPAEVHMSNAPVLSFPALPLFLFSLCCVSDEIVSTLGEGTFGRVMECIDHRRWVPVNSRKNSSCLLGFWFPDSSWEYLLAVLEFVETCSTLR